VNNRKLNIASAALLVLVVYFAIGFIVYPVISLVKESLSAQGSYLSLLSSTAVQASVNSVLLSLITVAGSAVIGVYFAYVLHYGNIPFKPFISALLLIPIATPPIVGVVGFLYLVSDNGLLLRLLEMIFGVKNIISFDGWRAIIIVHLYSFYPFFFLFTSAALKKLDPNLLDASYSLGASKIKTFGKVILPLLTPSIIGASLITFMASMASFSAPFIFGGSNRFLTTEIYNAKINGDNAYSAAISVALTVISLIFLYFSRFRSSADKYSYSSKGTAREIKYDKTKRIDFTSAVISVVFAALVLLPILALLFLSLIPEGSLMRNMFAEPFTVQNYLRMFGEQNFFEPVLNSLRMSVAAVALSIIIGVSAAFLIVKKQITGGRLMETLLSIPYGIPGTVIALSFIVSFNIPTLFTAFNPIVGTFWILPLAYAVRNIPVLMQSTMSGLQTLDPSLEEAASSLGSGGFTTFRRITVPVIFPTILNGALLVFIASAGEFVSTILLYTYSTKTVSIEIYNQLRTYNTGIGAAYGVILFLIVMVVVYFSRRTLDRAV
jgi:iron(III) transport system permease protein